MSRFNFGDTSDFPSRNRFGGNSLTTNDQPLYGLPSRPKPRPSAAASERERSVDSNASANDGRALPAPPVRSAARERRGGQQFGGYGGFDDGAGSVGGSTARVDNPYAASAARDDNPYAANGARDDNPYAASAPRDDNPYAADFSQSSGYNNGGSNSSISTSRYDENPYADSNPYSVNTGDYNSRYREKPVSPERRRPRDRERDRERSLPRPTAMERASAKRRSDGSGWTQRSPTRRPAVGYGSGTEQMERVMRTVRSDWQFMTEEKCIPVQIALQLMDDSSLGLARKYGRFRETHDLLQAALRQIVNEQHQGFNSSIGRFHAIQGALGASQSRLRQLKENMTGAKKSLASTRPELQGLAKSSQNYDDMLMILGSIEQLQAIPEKLEAFISEKRFISAVETLQEAQKTMAKKGMEDIGALNTLRIYLSNQDASLTDILIEELHNHLYLKSPYCEHRWKDHASAHVKGISKDSMKPVNGRALYQFLNQLDTDVVLGDDLARNPEADTFHYIHLMIESLSLLGRLDTAVETIAQRLPVELFRVVEKSSVEVDQRYPASLRTGTDFNSPLFDFTSSNSPRSVIMNDLFGTIFARFEAISEGHRAVHEVISGITKREGTKGSSALTGGFRELWKLYQSEIRTLFHDYLATNDPAFKRRNDDAGAGSIFDKNSRNKSKKIFALKDMDSKATDLFDEKESLQTILTTSVPGLVSDSKSKDGTSNAIVSAAANGTVATDASATGHKLLVEPSVFNMAVLLPPSLTFLNRLKEVVPPSSDIAMSTLTSFLDDFLINVFLPQLDETLVEMCSKILIESDAFSQDPTWQLHARRPIFKGTARFYDLIEAFCKMLDILPHDQAFTELIISQVALYYNKCCTWFKATISRSKPNPYTNKLVKASVAFLEDESFKAIANELLAAAMQDDFLPVDQEISQFLTLAGANDLEDADIVLDRRALGGICLLGTSTKWLANKLKQLRYVSTQIADAPKRHSERFDRQRRWTLITTEKQSEPERVFLPLTSETADTFDGVHKSYEDLSSDVLRLLHVEIRTHIVYYIQKSMSRTFLLDQELNEPDPEVVSLNADLVGFDEELASHLPDNQRKFVTNGLASLLDAYILLRIPKIDAMNNAGCSRQQLNILVLQQNLKNIEDGAQLPRSAMYLDMFSTGPDAIVAEAKTKGKDLGFSYEELRTLLQLSYSENRKSDRREVAVAAERGLEEKQLELSEVMW